MVSLRDTFRLGLQNSDFEKDQTFAQLVKGAVMQLGAKVDLSFPEDVSSVLKNTYYIGEIIKGQLNSKGIFVFFNSPKK